MKRYSREVYYYETDRMSIVHNSNYLRIFEEARLSYMEQIGIPYPEIEAAGILIPVVDAYVRFHQTLKYGDRFYVDVKLKEFNGARMIYEYEIHRENDDELVTTGFSSHCFVDEGTRIPLTIKRRLPEAYETVLKNAASDLNS